MCFVIFVDVTFGRKFRCSLAVQRKLQMLTTSLVTTNTEREVAEVTESERTRKVGGDTPNFQGKVLGTVSSYLVDSQSSIFRWAPFDINLPSPGCEEVSVELATTMTTFPAATRCAVWPVFSSESKILHVIFNRRKPRPISNDYSRQCYAAFTASTRSQGLRRKPPMEYNERVRTMENRWHSSLSKGTSAALYLQWQIFHPQGRLCGGTMLELQQTAKHKQRHLRCCKIDCWLVDAPRSIPRRKYAKRVSSPRVLIPKEYTGRDNLPRSLVHTDRHSQRRLDDLMLLSYESFTQCHHERYAGDSIITNTFCHPPPVTVREAVNSPKEQNRQG